MKSIIALIMFILCNFSLIGQSKVKPITIYGKYGSVEKIYIFKVEDTSLITITPKTYGLLKNQPAYHLEEIEELMREEKFGFSSQIYTAEEIGYIDVLGSSNKAKARAVSMIAGGAVGLIIGLIRHQGNGSDVCNDDLVPLNFGCYLDSVSDIPFHSMGVGVGIGAIMGGLLSKAPVKININGQRHKFKSQQEQLKNYAIF